MIKRCRGAVTGWSAIVAAAIAAISVAAPRTSRADEGGVSFWLPGTFASLSSVPQEAGFSLGTFYYHTSVDAGADVARAREITIGRFSRSLNLNLSANLHADADFVFLNPAYALPDPVLGGQATVSIGTLFGRTGTTVDGTQRRLRVEIAVASAGVR